MIGAISWLVHFLSKDIRKVIFPEVIASDDDQGQITPQA